MKYIDSPRRGFEIGFTVGLGFAMLENLQYIALSWAGGPLSFTLTSLIRAIGSIPGHAFWTGLTGIGFAYLISNNKKNQERFNHNQEFGVSNWQLIDSKTNEVIETTLKNENNVTSIENNFGMVHESENIKITQSKLPKNIFFCLFLAIFGHSFWNGSSYLVDYYSTKLVSEILFSTLISIIWIILLITSLFILGKVILRNVILLPDKMV
jgi:RsiW-degrading membrane proteinase PrsW (M82 family)